MPPRWGERVTLPATGRRGGRARGRTAQQARPGGHGSLRPDPSAASARCRQHSNAAHLPFSRRRWPLEDRLEDRGRPHPRERLTPRTCGGAGGAEGWVSHQLHVSHQHQHQLHGDRQRAPPTGQNCRKVLTNCPASLDVQLRVARQAYLICARGSGSQHGAAAHSGQRQLVQACEVYKC